MEQGTRTFDIAHCLGRGGFGEVYRANMRTIGGLESDVALKVLRRDLDPAGQAVQRLRDEGRLLARLDHPVILRVHDLALLEGRVALITEYIAGEDVETLMKDRVDPIGARALLEVIAKVAHALNAAWSSPLRDGTPLRLVHRDIKPSNIRVGKHGEVKLLDFGIARTDAVIREARTQTDMMVGSPAYMAPERFRENALDPASDVFALGATLLEGITHRRFYGRMELPRIAGLSMDARAFDAHTQTQLDKLPEGIHPELLQLLRDTLTHDSTTRITSHELADRAERLAEKVGGDALPRWCRARTWLPESEEAAEMSGRVVSEGTLAMPAASLDRWPLPEPESATLDETSLAPYPVYEEPARRSPWVMVALLIAAVGAAGTAGLFAAALSGLAFTQYTGRLGRPPVEAPAPEIPTEAPGPEPTPDPVPDGDPIEQPPGEDTPEPAPQPRPDRPPPKPSPQPSPEPAPAPSPVAPSPTPAPAPAPAPAPSNATISVTGGVTVVAVGSGRTVPLPGLLTPGSWTFKAAFSGDSVEIGSREIAAGEAWLIACTKRMSQCQIGRQ